jgi:hypothetical protein
MSPHVFRALALPWLAFWLTAAVPLSAQRPARPHSAAADSLSSALIALERQSWAAWQAQDSSFFRHFLSADHVEVGFGGPVSADAVVNAIGARACTVRSYTTDNFTVTLLNAATALVTYRATQATTCGTTRVPSPVWAASLYLLRDRRWQNVLYEQTPTAP